MMTLRNFGGLGALVGGVSPVLWVCLVGLMCWVGACSYEGELARIQCGDSSQCTGGAVCDQEFGYCVVYLAPPDAGPGLDATDVRVPPDVADTVVPRDVPGPDAEDVAAPPDVAPARCDDGEQNGRETGVDCGGPVCAPCETGGGCEADGDCVSKKCEDGICPAPTCGDGVQNGDETGVDCGGGDCAPCPVCSQDSDCGQREEGAWGECVPPADDVCATVGERTRVVTTHQCVAGFCESTTRGGSEDCPLVTEGVRCAEPTDPPWSECTFADVCAGEGTQKRTVTSYACAQGACKPSMTEETRACGQRSTEGAVCGDPRPNAGGWSTCAPLPGSEVCGTAGEQSREFIIPVCQNQACVGEKTESRTRSCSINTNGSQCATPVNGVWGDCSNKGKCTERGYRERINSVFECGQGSCVEREVRERDDDVAECEVNIHDKCTLGSQDGYCNEARECVKCSRNEHCRPQQECVPGRYVCAKRCTTDAPCDPGQTCQVVGNTSDPHAPRYCL